MANKDSQKFMFEHSNIKVRLLQQYIEKYLSILTLSPSVKDVYLYDLFCGAGKYENGGLGSPLIFLNTILSILDSGSISIPSDMTFHCHFNDKDESKIEKLREEIQTSNLGGNQKISLTISKNLYRDILDPLTRKMDSLTSSERGFIFIDPYGYKDIRLSDIKGLLKSGKSEVLLFLPTQFMFRFENKATPESLKAFISELVPPDKWPKSNTGIMFIESLKDAFKKNLLDSQYVDSFIITRDKNQFFCLFFFTSHIYGFDKMLETKWELDEEEGRGWKYNVEGDLFSVIERTANTNKLEGALSDFLKIRARTNGELYEFTLSQGFLPKHSYALLLNHQKNGVITVETLQKTKVMSGAFYLSYKNYKSEPNKIIVKWRSQV